MNSKFLSILIIIMLVITSVIGIFVYREYKEYLNNDKQSSIDVVTTEAIEMEEERTEAIVELDSALIEEERKIVEQAYNLLWNQAIKVDREESRGLLRDVQILVPYRDFKSEYKVDAHILYFYAQQSLLIQSYRDNMDGKGHNESGTYDNHETYGQKFEDKHKSTIIKNLQELDPNNHGAFLPSHVMESLQNGLKNFFSITKEDWISIYNDKSVDWVENAESEAKENTELRTMNPQIGMSKEEVIRTKWGRPTKINKTENAYGVSEQWVYPNYQYLYFDDGILTSISTND